MAGKHTPGPWGRNINAKYPIFAGKAPNHKKIAFALGYGGHGGHGINAEEAEANLCLITEAPELLRLLKQLRTDAGGWIEGRGDDEDALLDAVDAVIARAEQRP